MIEPLAGGLIHSRLPLMIHRPVSGKLIGILEESDCESGGIGSTESRSLLHHWTNHRLGQNVRLELHEQIVDHHSAVASKNVQRNAGVIGHSVDHLAHLKRSGLEY